MKDFTISTQSASSRFENFTISLNGGSSAFGLRWHSSDIFKGITFDRKRHKDARVLLLFPDVIRSMIIKDQSAVVSLTTTGFSKAKKAAELAGPENKTLTVLLTDSDFEVLLTDDWADWKLEYPIFTRRHLICNFSQQSKGEWSLSSSYPGSLLFGCSEASQRFDSPTAAQLGCFQSLVLEAEKALKDAELRKEEAIKQSALKQAQCKAEQETLRNGMPLLWENTILPALQAWLSDTNRQSDFCLTVGRRFPNELKVDGESLNISINKDEDYQHFADLSDDYRIQIIKEWVLKQTQNPVVELDEF